MTKAELIEAIAKDTGCRKKVVSEIINSMVQNITLSLSQGDEVCLSNFGSFKLVQRAARIGRNPRNKEPVSIPARVVPIFKPGKTLKNAVSKIAFKKTEEARNEQR